MTRPNFSDYMQAVFAPLITAAGSFHLVGKLKTADLPEERKAEQFERLNTSSSVDDDIVSLPLDSFTFRFRNKHGFFLCVQREGLGADGCEQLSRWGQALGLTESPLDEAGFLFLVYSLGGSYKLKNEYLSREIAENVIDIIDASYDGHSIYDVKSWYSDVIMFSIPADHIFRSKNRYGIAASVSTYVDRFRSQTVSAALASIIGELTMLPNVNPENLYYVLTSTHWNHIIIELYKYLDGAFFLPLVKKLRELLNNEMSAMILAQHCKEGLQWREKEKASIESLFELLPKEDVLSSKLVSLSCSADLSAEDGVGVYARRIYKIRNQIVHQKDYDSPEPVKIDAASWPILAEYLCCLVNRLYTIYSADLGYRFEIEQIS